MKSPHKRLASAVLASSCALAGCDAKVSIELAASKFAQADQVTLAIDGVDLLDDGGSDHELDSSADAAINVLDYTDSDTVTLVDSAKTSSARYTGLRLHFADSGSVLTTSAGATYPIDTSLALSYADIDVQLGDKDSVDRLLILETRFSLYPSTSDPGHYTLMPVLRVVDTGHTGSIAGTVDSDLVESTECRQARTLGTGVAVYAFAGANVTPQDYVQNEGGSPVASADVVVSSDSTSFSYAFPFMAAGSYTLAVTCNADSENPTQNDGLKFLASATVTVAEGESETVTLAP